MHSMTASWPHGVNVAATVHLFATAAAPKLAEEEEAVVTTTHD